MEQMTALASRETERLRRSFKPRKVKLLFIGESAPCGGQFFYRQSGMTSHTARAFADAFERSFASLGEFLGFFKSRGCYLDDLSLVPVDGMPPRERALTLAANIPALAGRIRSTNPDVVVVVVKKIEKHVRKALVMARMDVPTYVLPFPGQGHQGVYIGGLCRILKQHLGTRPAIEKPTVLI
jgi:hypothetical protein